MLLTPNQQATRQALVDTAIELATEGGYDAVSMPEVAKLAGMSTAKAYQYIGTKISYWSRRCSASANGRQKTLNAIRIRAIPRPNGCVGKWRAS